MNSLKRKKSEWRSVNEEKRLFANDYLIVRFAKVLAKSRFMVMLSASLARWWGRRFFRISELFVAATMNPDFYSKNLSMLSLSAIQKKPTA